MSFNLNTKVNNLQWQINQIVAGSVTNPLSSNLNANNKSITNCNTLSSVSGSPLNLNAGASTVNIGSALNISDTLTINNNTVHNGLVVTDGLGDTSCFVVDQSGNVGIKVNPVSNLNSDFTVNGNANISGSVTVNTLNATTINGGNVLNNITAGTGLIKTGTSTNPTLSNTGVLSVNSGNSGISIGGLSSNPTISNTGLLGLSNLSNVGNGISIAGTFTSPIISANLVAGSGVSITPLTGGALEISSSSPSVSPVRLSHIQTSGSSSSPVSGGTLGYQSLAPLTGALLNDVIAGTSPDSNGVWLIDLTSVSLLLTGSVNSGVVFVGLGNNIDSNVYYNTSPTTATFGSIPTTYGGLPRIGPCPQMIVKISDLVSTCPNMASSSIWRLYFNNQSTDTMWVQTIPASINCVYYPTGMQ